MQEIMAAIARGMVARRWMLRHVLRQARARHRRPLTLAITVASGSTPRLPGLIGCLPPWPSPPRPVGL